MARFPYVPHGIWFTNKSAATRETATTTPQDFIHTFSTIIIAIKIVVDFSFVIDGTKDMSLTLVILFKECSVTEDTRSVLISSSVLSAF
jgi:hypothetical protein